eukprot:509267-Prorocentrum_minimum.AAC.4
MPVSSPSKCTNGLLVADLHKNAVELTVKTLLSRLLTRELNAPVDSLRRQYSSPRLGPSEENTRALERRVRNQGVTGYLTTKPEQHAYAIGAVVDCRVEGSLFWSYVSRVYGVMSVSCVGVAWSYSSAYASPLFVSVQMWTL